MEIEDRIVSSLLIIGSSLVKSGDQLVAQFGLNQQQFVTLRAISNQGPISQKQICSKLLFEKSHVSKVSRKLESLELIKIQQDPSDSRVTLLEVTEKGSQVIQKAMEIFNKENRNWLSSLSETEKLHAELVLDRLRSLT